MMICALIYTNDDAIIALQQELNRFSEWFVLNGINVFHFIDLGNLLIKVIT